ncbi:MAG: four helix bundle protein [Bacteroidota bacterium]
METINSFEDLETWKIARLLRIFVSEMSKTFPKEEEYKLKDQIIRSSRSVGNNISEGFGRYFFKENVKFCSNARGSLTETLDHVIIALDEKYINQNKFDEFKEIYSQCLKLLNGYMAYLRKAGKIPDDFKITQ